MAFIDKVKKLSKNFDSEKEKVLAKVKKDIEGRAQKGYKFMEYLPKGFRSLISAAIADIDLDEEEVSFEKYHDMLNHVIISLKKEGFDVSLSFRTNEEKVDRIYCITGVYLNIDW